MCICTIYKWACACVTCQCESAGIILLYKCTAWQLPLIVVPCFTAANVSHSSHIYVAQTEVRPPVHWASFWIEILNRCFCEMLLLLQLLWDYQKSDLAILKHQYISYFDALHSEWEWHAELTMSGTYGSYISDIFISHWSYWMHFTESVYKQHFRLQNSSCGICSDPEYEMYFLLDR